MRLTLSLATIAVALTTASCSDEATEAGTAQAMAEPAEAMALSEPASAEVPNGLEVAEQPEEVATVIESCHGGADTYCRGPVMIRVKNVVLSKVYEVSGGRIDLAAKATFSVENRTDSPIKFNMLRREVTELNLPNGAELVGDVPQRQALHVSGLTPCNSNMDECLTLQSEDFVILQPGESPATFNVTYSDRVGPQLAASTPRVENADLNVQLVVVSPDGGARKISASFSQVPIFNNLAS